MENPVYFSGVAAGETSGHYLYKQGSVWHFHENNVPEDFPCRPYALDGAFLPVRLRQEEGRATLVHINGWTLLSFWDRSGDERYNSCANFLVRGLLTFEEMVDRSRAAFPKLWERFTFEVKEYKP